MIHILIIDDEKIFCDCLGEFLTRHGFQVSLAYTAEQAIMKLEDRVFDVVVCDVCLPKTSGVTLLKMLKARYPLTSVIMMTGYISIAMAQECLSVGAYDFLYKPFRSEKLLAVLEDIRRRKNRWQELGIK